MPKITIQDFLKKKTGGEKITMLTAYDYPFAQRVDEAGIDGILVGDSLGMVVQGLDNTLPVTMEEMIYHAKIVSRAVNNAIVIGDMPFMSYQTGVQDALRNAGRFLKEAGAAAVKLEGGAEVAEQIRAMTRSDIPVMAHIGLTPQSIHRMGGYKVQGKTDEAANRLIEEAHIAEDAGAFSLLLEAIPMGLAKRITGELSISYSTFRSVFSEIKKWSMRIEITPPRKAPTPSSIQSIYLKIMFYLIKLCKI